MPEKALQRGSIQDVGPSGIQTSLELSREGNRGPFKTAEQCLAVFFFDGLKLLSVAWCLVGVWVLVLIEMGKKEGRKPRLTCTSEVLPGIVVCTGLCLGDMKIKGRDCRKPCCLSTLVATHMVKFLSHPDDSPSLLMLTLMGIPARHENKWEEVPTGRRDRSECRF